MTIVNGWVVELEVVVELGRSLPQKETRARPAGTVGAVAILLVSLNLAATSGSITKTARKICLNLMMSIQNGI
jgi:DMSO/TMAO reductase YedYZ heme-binding membrane subunit